MINKHKEIKANLLEAAKALNLGLAPPEDEGTEDSDDAMLLATAILKEITRILAGMDYGGAIKRAADEIVEEVSPKDEKSN